MKAIGSRRMKGAAGWGPALALVFLGAGLSNAATRVFFDGFESGNTNLWNADGTRPRCAAVGTADDGVAGPDAGSWMCRCDDPGAAWQTLNLPPFDLTSEVLYRYRVRVDRNHDSTGGSTHKLARLFHWDGVSDRYNDIFSMVAAVGPGAAMLNDVIINGVRANNGALYWGDAAGDETADPARWHTIEYYINKNTGVVKVWHDDILVQNWDFPPVNGPVGETGEFYIVSNWGDAHDAQNYVYFDNVEVFTDATSGTPATGLMSDGSIRAGTPDAIPPAAPTGLGVR